MVWQEQRSVHELAIVHAARHRAWLTAASVAAGAILAAGLYQTSLDLPPDWSDTPAAAARPVISLAFVISLMATAAMMIEPRRVARVAVTIAMICLALGWTLIRLAPPTGDLVADLSEEFCPGDAPRLVTLEGRVTHRYPARPLAQDSPEQSLFAQPSAAVVLRVDRLISDAEGSQPVTARVTIVGGGIGGDGLESLTRPGSRLRTRGMLTPQSRPMNPGEPDRRLRAAQDRSIGLLRLRSASDVNLASSVGPIDRLRGDWLSWRVGQRARVRSRFQTAGEAAPLIEALLLGDTAENSSDLREQFALSGVAHLMAISGFHVAVLLGVGLVAVRLTGDRPRIELIVTVVLLLALIVLVPLRTPVLRAVMLYSVLVVPRLAGRRYDALAMLGWITAALILLRPLDVLTLGFQLSVGITAFLLWLADTRHPWLSPRDDIINISQSRFARSIDVLRRSSATCLLCWLVAAPIIAWHTGRLQLFAPVVAMLATPIVSLTLVFGYAAAIIGGVSEPLSLVLGSVASTTGRIALWLVSIGSKTPGAVTTLPPLSMAWTIITAASVIGVVRARSLRSVRPMVAIVACAIWLVIEIWISSRLPIGVRARLDMLSVGDGSCLILRHGNDAAIWDCGSLSPGLGRRTIPDALRGIGARHIPIAIITHANMDHYAALPDIAPRIGLRRVYISGHALKAMRLKTTGPEHAMLLALDRLHIPVDPLFAGDAVHLDGADLHVLWPPETLPRGINASNDLSLVARFDVTTDASPRRMLLCGDIQRGAMAHLLDDPTLIDADILELPHHGSYHAIAEAFVEAVSPAVVLQSTGRSRLSEHRWARQKEAVALAGGAWWITARDGASHASVMSSGRIESGDVQSGSPN